MSSSRDYPSVAKSRRSSPGDAQCGVYFQTGHSSFQTTQGGRTVLPPLASAFPTSRSPAPNHYSQPRSSPGRSDYNVSSFYGPWPGTTPLQPLANSFPFYESHDARYPPQATYGPSYSTRSTTPTIPSDNHSSRRLPPLLATSDRDARWQSTSYPLQTATHIPVMGTTIRSPTASYTPSYGSYPQPESYSYPAVPDMRDVHTVSSMNHQPHVMQIPSSERIMVSRGDGHPSHSRTTSAVSSSTFNLIPASVLNQEPAVKKKRRRADANQLRVLNETYSRTAFPSTEERAELAKKLDMSARSVQIWFQNKRQSMRQTSRQSSASTQSSNQPFSMTPQSEVVLDEMGHMPVGSYASNTVSMGSIHDTPYMPRSSHVSSRAAILHSSQTPPPHHRRPRSHEESVDLHKWPRGY